MVLEQIDKITLLIGLAGLILLFGLPTYYYAQLPELTPFDSGLDGDLDGLRQKQDIWIGPLIGAGAFAFVILFLNLPKLLHQEKFDQKIPKKDQKVLKRTLIIGGTSLILMMCYSNYVLIQIALGKPSEQKIGIFIGVALIAPSIYILHKLKNK